MRKNVSLDYLKKNLQLQTENKDNPLLRLAALRGAFEMDELINQAKNLSSKAILKQDIEVLENKTFKISKSKHRMLDEHLRIDILNKLDKNDELKKTINQLKTESTDFVQKLLTQYIQNEAPPLEKQNINELAASFNISKWLEETHVTVPSKDEIKSFINQKQLLTPFELLTTNFQGRKKELARLSDYVDWLPKDNMISSSYKMFRNIINWHEKPPLMISGIGGVGKSTLIAKFILDHFKYRNKTKLPFIYLDLDKTGLSLNDPLALFIEGLNQIGIQFPTYKKQIQEIKNFILSIGSKNINQLESKRSRSGQRQFLIEEVIHKYKLPLNELDRPVLLVLDSFEEVQYRATTSELFSLIDFFAEVSSIIPRIRMVIVGRSELLISQYEFENIQLKEFDRQSAVAFLKSLGILNEQLRIQLVKKFGGNPLTLELVASVIQRNESGNTHSIGDIKTHEWLFSKINEHLIQEELFKRNLSHIHDIKVRKIALPGLVVRSVTPEVIQNVLAEPCNLGQINLQEAEEIFEQLKKEKFLIETVGNNINFRPDLRTALYPLIKQEMPEKTRQIHDLAINYFESKRHPNQEAAEAEAIYHRLMRGDKPDFLESTYEPQKLRPYLEYSLKELPVEKYVILAKWLGIGISEELIDELSPIEWEEYIQNEIENALTHSDESLLLHLERLLNNRSERTWETNLSYHEAHLNWRLGNYDSAIRIIDTQSKFGYKQLQKKYHLEARNQYLKSRVLEYNLNFKEGLSILENQLGQGVDDQLLSFEMAFLALRLGCRLDISSNKYGNWLKNLFDKARHSEKSKWEEYKTLILRLVPILKKIAMEQDLYSSFGEHIFQLESSYQPADYFIKDLEQLKERITDKKQLEEVSYEKHDLFLNDIAEPGVLSVNIIDYTIFNEQSEGLDPVLSSSVSLKR